MSHDLRLVFTPEHFEIVATCPCGYEEQLGSEVTVDQFQDIVDDHAGGDESVRGELTALGAIYSQTIVNAFRIEIDPRNRVAWGVLLAALGVLLTAIPLFVGAAMCAWAAGWKAFFPALGLAAISYAYGYRHGVSPP